MARKINYCCVCKKRAYGRVNGKGKHFCLLHFQRIKRGCDVNFSLKSPNKYHIVDDYVYIELYNCKNRKVNETVIDLKNFNIVKDKRIGIDGRGYVTIREGRKLKKLHRLIKCLSNEKNVIDHINGDKLDNTENNLREISHKENTWNNKKAKNYYFNKRRGKYIVRIYKNGKEHCIGAFKEEKEAKLCAKKSREKYFDKCIKTI